MNADEEVSADAAVGAFDVVGDFGAGGEVDGGVGVAGHGDIGAGICQKFLEEERDAEVDVGFFFAGGTGFIAGGFCAGVTAVGSAVAGVDDDGHVFEIFFGGVMGDVQFGEF